MTLGQPSAALFTLSETGELRAGTTSIGTLRADGTLVFTASADVTAKLDEDGRLEIWGPEDTIAALPGYLTRLLRVSEGHVRSSFDIHPDGSAELVDRTLTIAADGTLDGRLRVEGVTPATRKTAMFIYALMSTITQ